jgi:hypothetical protein
MHPGLLSRILSEADLKARDLPLHLFAMAATARSLGGVPELRLLGLRRHAHHFGYSGRPGGTRPHSAPCVTPESSGTRSGTARIQALRR